MSTYTTCALNCDLNIVALKLVALAKTSTSCATFRLSSEKLNRLREVPEDKNITPNILFNQIIKAHVNWHSMAART
jgi:hypothetical protein